jgi:pilus assembly protein Flp/PilA
MSHCALIAGINFRRNIMVKNVIAMLCDDKGQGLVEYALIIALVSIVAIAALSVLGKKASNTLSNAANSLS